MAEPWYTNPGETGPVTLDWDPEGWSVASTDVACLLQGGLSPDQATAPHEVHVHIEGYTVKTGDSQDFRLVETLRT